MCHCEPALVFRPGERSDEAIFMKINSFKDCFAKNARNDTVFYLRKLFVICLSVVILSGCEGLFSSPHPLIGQSAPNFVLKDLNGQTQSLAGLQGDKRAIVFFWATWCPHCRQQMKEIQARQAELNRLQIVFIPVDMMEAKEKVALYFSRMQFGFNALIDENGAVARQYKVVGVPSYFYVGSDGRVKTMAYELVRDLASVFK